MFFEASRVSPEKEWWMWALLRCSWKEYSYRSKLHTRRSLLSCSSCSEKTKKRKQHGMTAATRMSRMQARCWIERFNELSCCLILISREALSKKDSSDFGRYFFRLHQRNSKSVLETCSEKRRTKHSSAKEREGIYPALSNKQHGSLITVTCLWRLWQKRESNVGISIRLFARFGRESNLVSFLSLTSKRPRNYDHTNDISIPCHCLEKKKKKRQQRLETSNILLQLQEEGFTDKEEEVQT